MIYIIIGTILVAIGHFIQKDSLFLTGGVFIWMVMIQFYSTNIKYQIQEAKKQRDSDKRVVSVILAAFTVNLLFVLLLLWLFKTWKALIWTSVIWGGYQIIKYMKTR